jgi:competence protein ComEC
LFDVLLLAAAMQVALALPMAVYFHRAVLAALPANAAIVPLTGALMPAAIAAVALSYLWPPLAKLPALAAGLALKGITGVVAWLGAARGSEVRLATPEPAMMLFAIAAFVLAMLAVRRRAMVVAAALVVLVASALALVALPPKPQIRHGALEVTLLDVGQGDAILVISPEGKTLLIDAGGSLGGEHSDFDFGEDVVSPYLWQRGLRRLDAVALTHAHADHVGGLGSVLANFRPQELWLGPNPPIPALRAHGRAPGGRAIRLRRNRD